VVLPRFCSLASCYAAFPPFFFCFLSPFVVLAIDSFIAALRLLCDSLFTCEHYNTYRARPWNPFPLRRAHPGPGPHTAYVVERIWYKQDSQGSLSTSSSPPCISSAHREKELCVDNLLVRIHFIIVMMRWTGLAPWEFEFPSPGSLTSAFLAYVHLLAITLPGEHASFLRGAVHQSRIKSPWSGP